MKNLPAFFLPIVCAIHPLFGQVEKEMLPKHLKHINSYGISFDVGGGLEQATDIKTFFADETNKAELGTVGKPNLGFGLFWEHQWNFKGNHNLLFGIGASYTSFYCGVKFKNPEQFEMSDGTIIYTGSTNSYVLGDFRHGFASIEFPLYYSYSIPTKGGVFSPFLGVNLRNIAYVMDSGRNYGGVGSSTSEINGSDTLYYNKYLFRFGTKSITPILQPTVGLKYTRPLLGGGKINIHLKYQFFVSTMNTVEAYLSNYDNTENGQNYLYFYSGDPVTYNPETDTFHGTKQSIYFRVNLSAFHIGISYTFK